MRKIRNFLLGAIIAVMFTAAFSAIFMIFALFVTKAVQILGIPAQFHSLLGLFAIAAVCGGVVALCFED